MTAQPPTLTPARKGLITRALNEWGSDMLVHMVRDMPSFRGCSARQITAWAAEMGWHACDTPCATCADVTQAANEPADPGTTGEWYSVRAIAVGLGIGVERVYSWMQFGWLAGGPIFTAGDIRAFVRAHPLEIVPRYLGESEWLWLVSVLAGSRTTEGAA